MPPPIPPLIFKSLILFSGLYMTPYTTVFQYCHSFASPDNGGINWGGGGGDYCIILFVLLDFSLATSIYLLHGLLPGFNIKGEETLTCGESTNAPSCVSSAFIVKGKSTIVQRASWCFLISLITSQKTLFVEMSS